MTANGPSSLAAAALLSTLSLHGDGERVARLLARHPTATFAADCTDQCGRTPLHYAVANVAAAESIATRSPVLLPVLDHAGWSPLHYAVQRGRVDVSRALLVAGASPNQAINDKDARAPLHLAAANAHREMLQLLLDAGAIVGVHDARGGTPLHYAAVAAASLRPDDVDSARQIAVQSCIALLLERGAYVDARDECGETPLHWAAREAAVVALRVLLDSGADATVASYDNETPAVIAAVAKRSAAITNNEEELARATRCEQLVLDAAQRTAKKHEAGVGGSIFTFV